MSEKKITYQTLMRVPKHSHYYVNPLSDKITYRRSHNGKTIKIATGLTQIAKAKEFVEQEIQRRATGDSAAKVRADRRGVKNYGCKFLWDECVLDRVGREKATLFTYRTAWKYAIGPFWAGKTSKDFTESNIKSYQRWYLEEHPTRQYQHKFFVMWINFMVKKSYLQKKPDLAPIMEINDIIKSTNQVEVVGRVATEQECAALLVAHEEMLKTRVNGTNLYHKQLLAHRARLWVTLGLRYGLRKMEAGKLLWEKVDFKKKKIEVWSSKNKKWREVPLHPEVLSLFKTQREYAADSRFVFPMPTDPKQNISGQNFDKQWEKIKGFAGIEGRLRFHDLRKTFATKTAELGWPPVVACEILDMSLDVYQRIYCKASLKSKEQLLTATFESPIGGKK